jgi:hypothetical protein
MTIGREEAEKLLDRPGLREALAGWEQLRRPGQLIHFAEQHGATISVAEGEAIELQSVLRQSSRDSAQALRRRP